MVQAKRPLIRLLILACCAGFSFWLIRYEAFPQWFTQKIDGYEGLIGRDVLISESWLRIVYDGLPVGYSRTHMDIDENDPARRYILQNELMLGFNVAGRHRTVGLDMETILDAERMLRNVLVDAALGDFDVLAEIQRTGGERYNVNTSFGGVTNAFLINIPDDAIFFVPLTDLLTRRLRVGRSLSVRVFDPSTFSTRNLIINAVREETVATRDGERLATVLETDYHGMKIVTWVDRDDRILRQEAGAGIVLEPCTPQEGFAAFRESKAGVDLMRVFTGNVFSLGSGGRR